MIHRALHSWKLTPKEAVQLQHRLRARVRAMPIKTPVRFIAGADISWDPGTKKGYAGVIVYEWPSLKEVDRASSEGPAPFPYVPGLLSFREGPHLLQAFSRLKVEPDLIFFDGHGRAHPRRFGVACHIGLLLGKPAIGCGKSKLVGEFKMPAVRRGAWSPLLHKEETIGAVLRTKKGSQPIFISVGHRITLPEAIRWALATGEGKRIPKPTREADRWVGQMRSATLGARDAGIGRRNAA